MRSAGTARTRYFMATTLVIGLIGGLLATTIDTAPASGTSPIAPNFFAFSGSPFDDGLNHYVVNLDPTTRVDDADLLRLANDGSLEFGEAGIVASVSAEELANAIAGGGATDVSAASVVAAHSEIESLRPLGFDLYAAAGTIGLSEIRELPGVAMAEIDTRLATASADPLYPSQWALENSGATSEPWEVSADADIDAPEGWHRTRGTGVVVAVIDSGVDVFHPDLAANVWHNVDEVCGNGIDDDANGYTDDCVGWDFINDDNTPEDVNGHGTHVAGIIGAEADNRIGIAGVAYESQIMALKIGDGSPPLSAAIEAFAYAIDNGARVINASWVSDDPAAGAFLSPALDAASSAGVLVVTGAGNYSTDIDEVPVYPASMPHNNVIVVGASTPLDLPAEYSGYGDRSVDLFAPGEHIVSTLPGGGYGAYSGTSMAAPMVSGAAALLWSATPQATYAEVKGALLDRADGPNDGVDSFRHLAASDGRLNVERSVYSRLFQPSLMYTFHDFNSFEPSVAHDVTIVAKTVDPWIAPPQTPARYRLGLYVPYEGQPMAVVGYPVVHTYGGATTDAVTDGTGRALVGPVWEREERSVLVQGGDATELQMSLPTGTYAVTMEVVDVTDPADPQTMGEPSAVFFVVGIDGSVTQMPSNPIGGTTPTTAAPVTTTTDPSGGSTTTIPGEPSSSTSTSTTSVAPDPDSSTTTTTTAGPEDPEDPSASTTTTTTEPPTTVLPSTTTTTTTTTTEVPTTSTTEPGTTESTTTTTSTAPTTTVVDPDAMQITEVHPNEGPTAGGTLVTITGRNFPDLPLVDFGDTRGGSIISSTDKFIVLPTPRGSAGYVDVTVTDRATEGVATYPDGFLYTDDEPGSVTTTTEVTVTSGPPSSTTSSAPSPPSSTNPPSNGGSIDDWLGAVLVTPEGLTLAPPSPDDPINAVPIERWAGELCNEPVCPGWVLQG
jgi:subtilisin family serine protease